MTRFWPLLQLLAILAGTTGLDAQQFWQNQPYKQWTSRNCEKMLKDSPWALTFQILKEARDGLGHKEVRDFRYVVQILSALPIRQAMVRQAQIDQKYDKMSPDQKKTFDAGAESFLATSYADRLVFDVHAPALETVSESQKPYWPSETAESLKDFVVLIGPGNEKIPLTGYTFKKPKSYRAGDSVEFEFTFPKQINGHPVIAPGAQKLTLEFRDIGGWNLVDFSVSKMMRGTEVIY